MHKANNKVNILKVPETIEKKARYFLINFFYFYYYYIINKMDPPKLIGV